MLNAVRAAAQSAWVVVVGYLAILPDSGFGCWPTVPIAFGDVLYLRGVEAPATDAGHDGRRQRRQLRRHVHAVDRARRLPGRHTRWSKV